MPERARLISSTVSMRFLANEFQSDVQRFRTDPAGIGREAAHAFHEALNALADGVVNVEGNEDSHNRRQSLVVGRWLNSIRPNDQRPTTDLHQLSSHHIQRLLAGEPADVFAIAGKFSFHDFGSTVAGQSMENQSDRFRVSSAGRPGNARNRPSPKLRRCAGEFPPPERRPLRGSLRHAFR